MNNHRIPPQNITAEQEVIGACLMFGRVVPEVAEIVRPQDFYKPAHQEIFSAMLDLVASRNPVDLVTISARLSETGKSDEVGGPAYLASLIDGMPSQTNAGHYAHMVRRKAELRQIISSCAVLADKCYSEAFDGRDETTMADVASLVRDVVKASPGAAAGVRHISGHIDYALARMEAAADGGTVGIPTGFTDLDRMLSGLSPSDLIILAARPSMGKTAMAMNMAEHQAITMGIPVGVISLEMSGGALGARMLCGNSGVDSYRARIGKLSGDEWRMMRKAADALKKIPLYVDDTPAMKASIIQRKATRMRDDHGIEILYLDYLQIAKADQPGHSREREVAEISGALKAIAKELNIPVVALSQLNRSLESRPDKRPILSDLRDSGAIEQDADVILSIYRDEVYNQSPTNPKKGIAEIGIDKQRNGPTGRIELAWDARVTRFKNLITMHEKV